MRVANLGHYKTRLVFFNDGPGSTLIITSQEHQTVLVNISLWSQNERPKAGNLYHISFSYIILISAEFAQLKTGKEFLIMMNYESYPDPASPQHTSPPHHSSTMSLMRRMSCLCNESINATPSLIRSPLLPPDPTWLCHVLFFILSVCTACVRTWVCLLTRQWVCACLCDP